MDNYKHSQKCISLLNHNIDCTNLLTKKELSAKIESTIPIRLIKIIYLRDSKICEHEFNKLISDKINILLTNEAIGMYIEFNSTIKPLTILYRLEKTWLGNNEFTSYIKDKIINEDVSIISECICSWGKTSVLKYRRDLLNIVYSTATSQVLDCVGEVSLSTNEVKSLSNTENNVNEEIVNKEVIDKKVVNKEVIKCNKVKNSIDHLMENMLHTQLELAETQNNQMTILMNLMNKLSK